MNNVQLLFRLCLLIGVLLVFQVSAGCRQSELEVVIGPPEEEEEEVDLGGEYEEDIDPWEALAMESPREDPRFDPQFIPAEEAKEVPELILRDEDGTRRRLDPAGEWENEILIIVFWSLDTWTTRAAILHTDRLVRDYEAYGVWGVGVVGNPETYNHAPDFMEANGVGITSYFTDDFRALRSISRAVDRDIRDEVPCIFLIDREGRVRFSKLGFSSSAVSDRHFDASQVDIEENAPRGERIEDYLRRLITEDAEDDDVEE